MALVLRLGSRSRRRSVLFFSTNSNSPLSSLFNDNLKQSSPSNTTRSSFRTPPNSQPGFTDDINKNLHEFRARTTAPPPQQTSFQKQTIRDYLRRNFDQNQTETAKKASRQRLSLEEKLGMLRPEETKKDWFSVSERPGMMRKMEEEEEQKQAHSNTTAPPPQQTSFQKQTILDCLRRKFDQLDQNQTETAKKASRQRLRLEEKFGMLRPKETKKDWFSVSERPGMMRKMEEEEEEEEDLSYTTQILAFITSPNLLCMQLQYDPVADVHSHKGLIAMVKRRRRLLKYLKRTDWDSYCFVISKLELRDNPDHGYKTRSIWCGSIGSHIWWSDERKPKIRKMEKDNQPVDGKPAGLCRFHSGQSGCSAESPVFQVWFLQLRSAYQLLMQCVILFLFLYEEEIDIMVSPFNYFFYQPWVEFMTDVFISLAMFVLYGFGRLFH
ncbi:hypothetical protein D0Y65_021236 [Glycine soja]|nr:hypothetical protein D0Y65_021236 [Glycine soja]